MKNLAAVLPGQQIAAYWQAKKPMAQCPLVQDKPNEDRDEQGPWCLAKSQVMQLDITSFMGNRGRWSFETPLYQIYLEVRIYGIKVQFHQIIPFTKS